MRPEALRPDTARKARTHQKAFDLDAYWAYHIQQEHQRNHASRCKPGQMLAA